MAAGMLLRLIPPVAASIVVVFGLYVPWYRERRKLPRQERHPWYSLSLIVPCLAALAGLWSSFAFAAYDRVAAEEDATVLKKQAAHLRTKADKAEKEAAHLKEQAAYLRTKADNAESTLRPFRVAAQTAYPEETEERALERLGAVGWRLIPKLKRFEDRKPQEVDHATGVVTTFYCFGSPSAVPLTEVSIEMELDVAIVGIGVRGYTKRFAEKRTQEFDLGKDYTLGPNGSIIRFHTNFVDVGSQIWVTVQTTEAPTILGLVLRP